MFKREKEKFYVSLLIMFFLCAFLIWWGIIGLKFSINDSVNQIKEKNISIAAYSTRESSLSRNLENYNLVRYRMEEINDYFVDKDDNLPDFVSEMEDIAEKTSNFLVKDFIDNAGLDSENAAAKAKSAATKAKAPQEETSYALRLTLKGTFDQLMEFIAQFEAVPYYAYIDSVIINADSSFSSGDAANKKYLPGKITSVLTIRVFKKQNLDEEK